MICKNYKVGEQMILPRYGEITGIKLELFSSNMIKL